MDKAASLAAREEGNAHFRKGRWQPAAAAYARAGALDPTDAVCWANRAMAMLKLERYADAADDATRALAVDPANVKARYRRAVAYRALGDGRATADLEEVLRLDPNNAAAGAEMEEIRAAKEAKEKETEKETETEKEEEMETEGEKEKEKEGTTKESEKAPPPAAPAPAPSSAPTPAAPAPPAPAPAPAQAPTSAPQRAPADPTSTAPGAGLALLTALAAAPHDAHAYLRHYSPAIIARIVAPILEPDGLAVLLAAIGDDLRDEEKDWARETLSELRRCRRWKMTLAMLSRAERGVGERAWAAAGGVGPL